MPPALSDDEGSASSGAEQIPAKKQKQPKKVELVVEEQEEEEEEGEEEDDECAHIDSLPCLHCAEKLAGYDDPADMTWEDENNLEGVEALADYFEAIGGKPEIGKKRKGRQSGVKTESGTPVSVKRMKKEKEWAPPPGSWEDDVDHVDTVEQRMDPRTGRQEKFGYLVWKHHVKTQHPLPLIFKKCPQKMLAYFEAHLVFNEAKDEDDFNGIGNVDMTGVDDDDF
ncbi:hypothetical protein N0V90_004216 [Kalmusia sp. IMI 367209]|nr:hypothetical protein N0V90_004216 [Kalmusia sp. IMI 367209]